MFGNPWTDVRIEEVKRLWASGESASKIGGALGMSRNAVIGKVHRLRLPARSERMGGRVKKAVEPRSAEPARKVVRFIPKRHDSNDCHVWEAVDIPLDESPLSADDIPVTQRKSLQELEPHHCRFPYGDPGQPDFFFCGADKAVQSYCGFHARIAFRGIASSALTYSQSEIEARHRSRLAGRRKAAIEAAAAKQGGLRHE